MKEEEDEEVKKIKRTGKELEVREEKLHEVKHRSELGKEGRGGRNDEEKEPRRTESRRRKMRRNKRAWRRRPGEQHGR